MIRRVKASDGVTSPTTPRVDDGEARRGHGSSSDKHSKSSPQRRGGISPLVLVVIFVCVGGMVALISPRTMQDVEKQAYEAEKQIEQGVFGLEQEVLHYVQHEKQKPPLEHSGDGLANSQSQESRDATAAMMAQDSSWVDGEKKLKEKLKVLAERQAKGLDIGVPVLTRYLGEDIPAWPGEQMDIDEWKAKVAKRYEEMRDEEKVWREKVQKIMDSQTL